MKAIDRFLMQAEPDREHLGPVIVMGLPDGRAEVRAIVWAGTNRLVHHVRQVCIQYDSWADAEEAAATLRHQYRAVPWECGIIEYRREEVQPCLSAKS